MQLHCFCHHKCASTWMRHFFRMVAQGAHMNYFTHQGWNNYTIPVEGATAEIHLYNNSTIADLERMLEGERGIHLVRDPRDVLISEYFSMKYSHAINPDFAQSESKLDVAFFREKLTNMSFEEGLAFLAERAPYYEQIRNWKPGEHPDVMDIKYEDLLLDELAGFTVILAHLGIDVPARQIGHIVENLKFEKLAKRERGDERPAEHFRKGVAGDWMNYFAKDGPLKDKIYTEIGWILDTWGYAR